MTHRFNPAPGWPAPPTGWTPPAGWTPDPAWPPAPAGWDFWVDDEASSAQPVPAATALFAPRAAHPVLGRRTTVSYARAAAVLAGALVLGAAVGAGGANGSDTAALATIPTSRPSVSVSVSVSSAPTVTVTSTPEPAPTVTVTSAPVPAPTVTVTAAPRATKAAPLVAPPATRRPVAPKPAAPKPAAPAAAYYANCSAARAAGAAPLYRGEPGYRSGLDRDNDGVACE